MANTPQFRHAAHYANVLGELNSLYRAGGPSQAVALSLFATEEINIDAGQSWAAQHAVDDGVLAWFFSVASAGFLAAVVVWAILGSISAAGRRSAANWMGLCAGMIISAGLGLLRWSSAIETEERVLAVALTLLEVGLSAYEARCNPWRSSPQESLRPAGSGAGSQMAGLACI